jgi:hypothetical protein
LTLGTSWVSELVSRPESFAARTDAARDGWIALHRNDWPTAASLGGDPAARAHAELARFWAVLAGTNASAWARLGERWRGRGLDPSSLLLPLAVAVDNDAWGVAPDPATLPERVLERLALHGEVRAGTRPPSDLLALIAAPLLVESGAQGERRIPDPWVAHTLTLVEQHSSSAQPPSDTLLFSGFLADPDTAGGSGMALPAPAPPAAPAEDADAAHSADLAWQVADADLCRGQVRSLDAELDAWKAGLASSASEDGRRLLAELRLVEGARSRALVDLSVAALNARRAGCALALAQLALDHESPRDIGPLNSPTLFAVLANAQLILGRSREALDALEVLVDSYPAVTSIDETIGTLVVLEGLDRRGDSRE